jgi:hypothetical protein
LLQYSVFVGKKGFPCQVALDKYSNYKSAPLSPSDEKQNIIWLSELLNLRLKPFLMEFS